MVLSSQPQRDFDSIVRANSQGLNEETSTQEILERVERTSSLYSARPETVLDSLTTRFGVLARFTKSGFITEDQRDAVARLIDPKRAEPDSF